MKVILLEHIENLGKKGEVVNVKRGYARNYLIPREYAIYGTPANMKRLGSIQDELKLAEEKKLAELKNLAEKIASIKLTFVRKVDEQGSMFGSVSENDIVSALKEQGVEIQRSSVQMEHHVKELGEHKLQLRLHKEIQVDLNFDVTAEAE
ncbi:MAG: 50S ribosomal protein L9 [Candidatus Cloacimonetes bacterium]|jgi:large subunit ribosomal protein L9|nr:50S ribosomal protein L9 [Candidatus Cloacimonadota bacterium]MDY0337193.1 50S ribosomal protein L9 [Candidatus Cloacimonadaceae bacterium]MCB5268785.1 50S ribosomal protein L9 [Candidatus Cloacimonadota bacterium]MCK9334052.1 50S ribosomal protein L9 [Candidatus Cloacimonadota bacterium]MDD2543644.1 50S ribosomal protein L9 [Candidatus Cloacimonadota bacterium]